MNLINLIKRDDSRNSRMDMALEELQAGVAEAIEESLSHEIDLPVTANEVEIDANAGETDGSAVGQDLAAVASKPSGEEASAPASGVRLTPHAQSRLAALGSFEKLYDDAQSHLRDIDERLCDITNSHQLTRKFFGILQTDIRRGSDLELANAGLIADRRMLAEQLAEANKARQEHESEIEALHKRESKLLHDNEGIRGALAAAKLEVVECESTITRLEAELGDLVKTLSARSMEVERRSRENEMLREKQVSLSIELDKAHKRETDLGRNVDEVATFLASEKTRNSELLDTLSRNEKDMLRLQKALEGSQAKHSEAIEAARIAEADREGEIERTQAEMSRLRSEIQSLRSRLELAANETSEMSSEIARVKFQLSDAATERRIAEEKIAALTRESENDKKSLLAANTTISQLSLQQASEQLQLETHKQQCENLRGEIATLTARIKELLPYERLYRIAKARQRDTADGDAQRADGDAEQAGSVPESIPALDRRGPRSTRRRAAQPA